MRSLIVPAIVLAVVGGAFVSGVLEIDRLRRDNAMLRGVICRNALGISASYCAIFPPADAPKP